MKPHFSIPSESAVVSGGETRVLTAQKMIAPAAGFSTAAPRVMVGPEAGPCRQPQITVRKEGDEVAAIDVLCSCGERITIELKY